MSGGPPLGNDDKAENSSLASRLKKQQSGNEKDYLSRGCGAGWAAAAKAKYNVAIYFNDIHAKDAKNIAEYVQSVLGQK